MLHMLGWLLMARVLWLLDRSSGLFTKDGSHCIFYKSTGAYRPPPPPRLLQHQSPPITLNAAFAARADAYTVHTLWT